MGPDDELPDVGEVQLWFFGAAAALGVWLIGSVVAPDASAAELLTQLVGVVGMIGVGVAVFQLGRYRGWWR